MLMYIYGAGHRCDILLNLLKDSFIEVVGVVDSDKSKWGIKREGLLVLSPDIMFDLEDEYVCVSFFGENDDEPIWTELIQTYDVRKDRILSFHDVLQLYYGNYLKDYSKISSSIDVKWKHVFSFAWEFQLGGVEVWANSTIKVLSGTDNNLYVISPRKQLDDLLEDKRKIIDFCIEQSCEFSKKSVVESINLIINQLPCILICSRNDEITLAASVIKALYPELIKIIMVVHGACDGMIHDMYSYNAVTDLYVCVSTAVQVALTKVGVNVAKCSVIPYLIDQTINKCKQYTLNREQPLKLGYAGRLEIFHKRSDLLIELIRDLEKLGINYEFEIAGCGTYSAEIVRFIEDDILKNKVTYIGVVEHLQIMQFWEDKDIAINVSDSEGRPISLVEAMFCGAVPVVTATNGVLEDVKDGITGYIVDIGDHLQMAERIAKISKDRFLLTKIGTNAQQLIGEKTSCTIYINEWIRIINGVEQNE